MSSIGVTEDDIINNPLLVNTGNSFVIIGVKDKNILAKLKLNFDSISSISEELDLIGYYVYTNETQDKDSDVSTRMFFPRYGVDEEAATGMAAGPMACYLYDKMAIKKERFSIEQGHFMPAPSASKIIINLDTSKGQIVSLMAGGKANVSKEVEIDL